MGFLNFLKKLKGGNFGLIARNIASIYFLLKRKYPDSFPDEVSLLATAGLIDTLNYRSAGNPIPIDKIKNTAYEVVNAQYLKQDELSVLSQFIVQMEVIIFVFSSKRTDYFTILKAVRSNFPVIYDSTEEVLVEGNISTKWGNTVDKFMYSDIYSEDRRLLGISK